MAACEATAMDVAAYVLHELGPTTALKLDKLVYYGQAWSLVWDQRPLFDEEIEAWEQGPVVPDLFNLHRGQYRVSRVNGANPERLDTLARETVDVVVDQYRQCSGHDLARKTHEEEPWRNTGRNQPISSVVMRDYYSRLGLDAVRDIGRLSEKFLAKQLSAKITDDNRHSAVEWGHPVGEEAL